MGNKNFKLSYVRACAGMPLVLVIMTIIGFFTKNTSFAVAGVIALAFIAGWGWLLICSTGVFKCKRLRKKTKRKPLLRTSKRRLSNA